MNTRENVETLQPSEDYQPIEDYAVIGDLHTVALVGRNGSIDWCCIPRFDSPSVFGSLLDVNKGGFFRISPLLDQGVKCGRKQLYLPETNILITRFLTADGVGEITDFMPVKTSRLVDHQHNIIRSVSVVRGSLSFEIVCRPAFNFARDPHQLHLHENGAIFESGADAGRRPGGSTRYLHSARRRVGPIFARERASQRPGATPHQPWRISRDVSKNAQLLAALDRAMPVHRSLARDGSSLSPGS
jgi:GH15 family glucan-1,4-alpha-glucosidase